MRTLRVADATLTFVPDGSAWIDPGVLFPTSTDVDWQAKAEYLDEAGQLINTLGAVLVQRDGRALLIDAGLGTVSTSAWGGPIKAVESGEMLNNLALAGCPLDSIESVAITHLHHDHIGWAWRDAPGSDHSAFSHCSYLVSDTEWAGRAHGGDHGVHPEALDKLEPNVRTFADGEEVFPGVHARVRGGHTSGHTTFVITAGAHRIVIFGDIFLTSAQISNPEWSLTIDHDPDLAIAERQRLLDELATPNTIGVGAHFADVVFGRIDMDGGATWEPVDEV
ncbi:hypothetical protein RU01_21820 [Rhodococcus sp. MEB064]|nr:hypothetical protein RU01_21820 [Rhodococcus sp. MEB064]